MILYEILIFLLTFDFKCVFHALCLWAVSQAQEILPVPKLTRQKMVSDSAVAKTLAVLTEREGVKQIVDSPVCFPCNNSSVTGQEARHS